MSCPITSAHLTIRVLIAGLAVVLAGCSSAAPSSTPASKTSPPPASPFSTVSASPSVPASASPSDAWLVVAIGDSIPFNDPHDCPGCHAFVDLYADGLAEKSGHAVDVKNLSEHTGLRIQTMINEIASRTATKTTLADAEAIIVGIGFNDVPFNVDDDPCDGAQSWDTRDGAIAGAKKLTPACVGTWAETMRPLFKEAYSAIADLRKGEPTILLTTNRYNDNPGWCENRTCLWGAPPTPAEVITGTKAAVDAWDKMTCEEAVAAGFTCIDVYHSFNGRTGTDGAGDLLADDYTHPSQAGNDRIAELLAAAGYQPLVP